MHLHRFVAALLVAALGACTATSPPDPHRYVSPDTPAALLLGPLDALQPALGGFLNGIEGAQGVTDWVQLRYGIAAGDPASSRAAGFDVRAGAALAVAGDNLLLAVGVADPSVATAFLADRLRLFGYDPPRLAAAEAAALPVYEVLARESGEPRPGVAFAIHDRVLLVALPLDGDPSAAPPVAALAAHIAAATAPDAVPITAGPRAQRLFGAARADAAPALVRAIGHGPTLLFDSAAVSAAIAPLGFAGGMVRGFLRGFDALGGHLEIADHRMAAHVSLLRRDGATPFPTTAFDTGASADFGSLFPSSTPLFLRGRVRLDSITSLLSLFGGRLRLPNPVAGFHSEFAVIDIQNDLLPHLTGDFAIGLLGIADGASLGSLQGSLAKPAELPRHADLVLALRVKDRAAFLAAVATHRQNRPPRPALPGVAVVPLEGTPVDTAPEIVALRLLGGGMAHLGVAMIGDVAVVAVGREALERVVQASAAKAPTLADRARTDLDRAVVGATPFVLAAHVSFDRIARQLQCRGFPPYFLKVMTSPDTIALSLQATPEGLHLSVEVAQ